MLLKGVLRNEMRKRKAWRRKTDSPEVRNVRQWVAGSSAPNAEYPTEDTAADHYTKRMIKSPPAKSKNIKYAPL